MKKINLLFLLILLGGVTLWGQDAKPVANKYLWHGLGETTVTLEGKQPQNLPGTVITTSDGNLILTSYTKTFTREEKISMTLTVGAENQTTTSTGDVAKKNSATGTSNLAFYKVTPQGKMLWQLYSTRSDIYSNYDHMVPTPDGGFLVYFTCRGSQVSKEDDGDLLRFVQPDGKNYDVELGSVVVDKDNQGHRKDVTVLLRVDASGKIVLHKKIEASHAPAEAPSSHYAWGTPSAIRSKSVATDKDGNIYLAGNFCSEITIDGKNYKAKNVKGWTGDPQKSVGDFFVIKLNPQGKVLAFLQETGDVITQSVAEKLIVDSDKLYVAYSLKGEGAKKIKFGTIEVDAAEGIRIGILCTDLGLTPEWSKIYKVEAIGGNSVLCFIQAFEADAENFYFGGRMQGGIKNTKGEWVIEQPAKKHTAYALAFDRQGNLREGCGYVNKEKNISNVLGIHTVNGKVFVSYYELFKGTRYEEFDAGMKIGSSKNYVASEPSATLFGSAIVEGRIVMAARLQGMTGGGIPLEGEDKLTITPAEKKGWASLWVARELLLPSIILQNKEIRFGNVAVGDVVSKEIQIDTRNLTQELSISIEGASAFSTETTKLPKDGGKVIVKFVSPKGTTEPTELKAKLIIRHGIYKEEILLSGMANPSGSLTSDVATYDYGTVPVDQKKDKEFVITAKGLTGEISVTVEGSKSFAVKESILPKEGGTIAVTYAPATYPLATAEKAVIKLVSGKVVHRIEIQGTPAERVAVEHITSKPTFITVSASSVVVATTRPQQVCVFDINGQLIYRSDVIGEQEISLTPGKYVLTCGQEIHKVIIR